MAVLVTRPQPEADRTAGRIRARGRLAVVAPVTRIVANPLPDVPRCGAIAATSAHAAEAVAGHDLSRDLPVYAVGDATAEAFRALGFHRFHVGDGGATALAARILRDRPGRILYLAAADRKPILEDALAHAGEPVTIVEAYRAEPVSRWPDETCAAIRLNGITTALHFSRRSAELAWDLARQAGLAEEFLHWRHLCLSPDVALGLPDGAGTQAIAQRPREDALLRLLDG